MTSVLKVVLYILSCKLRFTRGLILRFFKSWAQFSAFLSRRLGLCPQNTGKGTFQKSEKTAYSLPGTEARIDMRQDNAIAFSSIPASASHPSVQDSDASSTIAEPVVVQQAQLVSIDRLEASSHSHASPPASPTRVHGHRRGQHSTSVVGIENPSIPSLPRSYLVDSPESPYLVDSTTVHSSPASKLSDLPQESPQLTSTAAFPIPDFDLPVPFGRHLVLMNSEQVPRYIKGVTMQVNVIITASISYVSW